MLKTLQRAFSWSRKLQRRLGREAIFLPYWLLFTGFFVKSRSEFKILLLTNKISNDKAISYLKDLIVLWYLSTSHTALCSQTVGFKSFLKVEWEIWAFRACYYRTNSQFGCVRQTLSPLLTLGSKLYFLIIQLQKVTMNHPLVKLQ